MAGQQHAWQVHKLHLWDFGEACVISGNIGQLSLWCSFHNATHFGKPKNLTMRRRFGYDIRHIHVSRVQILGTRVTTGLEESFPESVNLEPAL